MVRHYKRKTDRVYEWKAPRTRTWDKVYEAKREAKKALLEAKMRAYEASLEESKLEAEAIEAYMLAKKSQINHVQEEGRCEEAVAQV